MERDIIGSVIEVEAEIRKRLETEQRKSREWLERIRQDAEAEIRNEEASLQDNYNRSLLSEKEAAEKKSTVLLSHEKEKAARLEGLSDTVLNRIVSKHMIMILPGDSHDSADVKNPNRGAQRTS